MLIFVCFFKTNATNATDQDILQGNVEWIKTAVTDVMIWVILQETVAKKSIQVLVM